MRERSRVQPVVFGAFVAAIGTNGAVFGCSDDGDAGSSSGGRGGAAVDAGQESGVGGGAGNAGSAGTFGSAGAGTGGASGSGGSGGASGSGGSGGGAGTGGSSGSGGSGGAAGTGAGGAGGTSGSGGAGGTGGTAGGTGGTGGSSAGDRCDVAIHDPANPPQVLALTGSLGTHDPTLIEQDGVFYEFQTGPRLPAKTSSDLLRWTDAPRALGNSNPGWIAGQVPEATDLWAPDLSFFGGQHHLYYSASSFGSNYSCIGHATRASLATGSWTDRGSVVCSNHGSNDNWNAIDPNVVVDQAGTPWLSFGSFWSGIKAIELDQSGARRNSDLHAIASRGGGAIEAPVIVRRCGYYYLFVSFDRCCDGANSTYNIRVGRAQNVLGPYVDKNGTSMMSGGGTLLVQGAGRWRGPGHNAVLFTGNRAYNFYHSYDADNGGRSVLRGAELVWDASGWPISGGP
jgi:arabinan endo-1,5-alpha-L-arabinosidase